MSVEPASRLLCMLQEIMLSVILLNDDDDDDECD